MRPTRRGLAVLALVALAMLAATLSGQRSLNAVAAPLLGAVGYGVVQCWRAGEPTVAVASVRPGHPGDSRTLTVSFEGDGVLQVASDWPSGVEGESIDAVLAPPDSLSVEVALAERGVHELGGIDVARRDALGLVRTPVAVTEPATVVVYPQISRLGSADALSALLADDHHVERQEFDRLREYEPGDPLRQVHWASSAKRGEFFVVEYAPDARTRQVTIAAEASADHADEMATAAATVASAALRAGLDVGLTLPDERVPPGGGEAHRANVLSALARADAGRLADADREAADVAVVATDAGTAVHLGDRTVDFAALREPDTETTEREVMPA